MPPPLPAHLIPKQPRIEALIRRAFRGVSRAGGVSWTESMVIDNRGTDADRLEARQQDTDARWEDLVDDPNWFAEDFCIGGWNFLDPIGFRYYLAPAMIRALRRGGNEPLSYALCADGDFGREQVSLLTSSQLHTTARFVWFMIRTHNAANDHIYGEAWNHAYRAFWREWDVGGLNTP